MALKADLEDVFGLIRKLAHIVLAGDTLAEFEAALGAFEEGNTPAAVVDVAEGAADAVQTAVTPPPAEEPPVADAATETPAASEPS